MSEEKSSGSKRFAEKKADAEEKLQELASLVDDIASLGPSPDMLEEIKDFVITQLAEQRVNGAKNGTNDGGSGLDLGGHDFLGAMATLFEEATGESPDPDVLIYTHKRVQAAEQREELARQNRDHWLEDISVAKAMMSDMVNSSLDSIDLIALVDEAEKKAVRRNVKTAKNVDSKPKGRAIPGMPTVAPEKPKEKKSGSAKLKRRRRNLI